MSNTELQPQPENVLVKFTPLLFFSSDTQSHAAQAEPELAVKHRHLAEDLETPVLRLLPLPLVQVWATTPHFSFQTLPWFGV